MTSETIVQTTNTQISLSSCKSLIRCNLETKVPLIFASKIKALIIIKKITRYRISIELAASLENVTFSLSELSHSSHLEIIPIHVTFVTIEICEICEICKIFAIIVIIVKIVIRETTALLEVGTQEIEIEAINTIAISRETTGMTSGTTTENNVLMTMIQETKNTKIRSQIHLAITGQIRNTTEVGNTQTDTEERYV